MKNIKKIAVLVTAIGAMAALAVPSMASAKVWGPVNTNQTLGGSSTSVYYRTQYSPGTFNWNCVGHQLGVHVRTPASSTLDVTSASWSLCGGSQPASFCTVSMVPVGLPWTAVSTASGVVVTEHAKVTYSGAGCWSPSPTVVDVDGTLTATWDAAHHQLRFEYTAGYGLDLTYMGSLLDHAGATSWMGNGSLTLT